MHLDKIRSIFNFNKDVIRNTPILITEDDGLSDLIDDQFDIDVAKKTIDKQRNSYVSKVDYHAVDYIFKQESCFESRFTDGSYSVWYASLDQETTFHETAFHWHQTIIQDMYYAEDEPIITNRSLFTVNCNAILIDLRQSIDLIPELIDKDIKSYKATQSLSKKIHKQGQSGLYTYSARKKKGENIAIFNRKVLNNPEHLDDLKYVYDFKKSKIFIFNKKSGELILEI